MAQELRSLTEYEIDSMLQFIKPQKGIPIDTAVSIVALNKKGLREQLVSVQIYPEMIPTLAEMIEKQFFETTIQAGESVGVIGAQSIGEKQTQTTLNSVDWKDKVLYSCNGDVFVEPIGQMIDRLIENNKEKVQYLQENKTEYLELPKGYYIPSGDMNGFQKWRSIEAVTKHIPNGKLVKVTTQSGRVVTASQCKSFLVWNGNMFESTLGSDIKIGDVLPTSSYLPLHTKEKNAYLNLETFFPKSEYIYSTEIVKAREYREKTEYWWKYHGTKFITPCKRGDTLFGKRKELFLSMTEGYVFLPKGKIVSCIPEKIPLDNDFGFLIGIYLAEGLTTKTYVSIANNNVIIRQKVEQWCDRQGITYRTVEWKGNQKRKNISSYGLTIHSVLLARLLANVCGTGSANKKVPEFSYTAPKEFIEGLIDGYISGNGTISKRDGYIVASFASENMIHGISFLLSYFGVFGKISEIRIKNTNMESGDIKPVHTLSICNGYAKRFANKINLTEKNKQTLLENITKTKKYKHDLGLYMQEYPHDRDVYFDKVVSVEYVESTTGMVYDFTVAETRNFNLFNGLVIRDTFHKAGSGEKTVTTGVPRVEELLNATKEPKSVNCFVKMKDIHSTIAEMRETIGYKVVELTFERISVSYDIVMDKEPEKWYEAFKILHGDEFSKYTDCISLQIDLDILYEYKLDMETIADIVAKKYDDIRCVFSPGNISKEPGKNIGQMDMFVDTTNIDLPESRLIFINTDNAKEIYLEEVVQPIIYSIIICGVQGITDIYFNDDANSFETDGTNFQKLLGLSFIDASETISNDVWDIYHTLGVEAARQFLIEEFMSMMEGINECHIEILVEKMTHSGSISSISRYTMRNEECGPMGKASFEETMDNFLKAGIYGQDEATRGVSASIICGKIAQIGTGVCDLIIDDKRLPSTPPILDDMVYEKKSNRSPPPTIKVSSPKKLEKRLQKKKKKKFSFSSDDTSGEDEAVLSKKSKKKKKINTSSDEEEVVLSKSKKSRKSLPASSVESVTQQMTYLEF